MFTIRVIPFDGQHKSLPLPKSCSTLKTLSPMVPVKLKIVEEGLKHPLEALKKALSDQLFEDDVILSDDAEHTLKIKFTNDNGQDLILLQLRDSATKNKRSEKVIHYLADSWEEDIASEAHALVTSLHSVAG
jgi:hypothetical protein